MKEALVLNVIGKRLLAAAALSTTLALGAAAQTPPAASGPRMGLGDYMTDFV